MTLQTGPMFQKQTRIQPQPPYDFAQALRFVGEFPPTMTEQNLTHQVMTKGLRVQGRTVAFRVTSEGTVDQPVLDCTIYAHTPIDEDFASLVTDRVRFFLGADDQLGSFYALAKDDLAFEQIITQLYGYHQVKFLTPFENACWAILSQRQPLTTAFHIKQKIIERYSDSIVIDNVHYTAFPEPDDFLPLDETDLAAITGNPRKAAYLRSAIKAFAGVDENFLRYGAFDDVKAWLLQIKGIGEWSAAFVLMRGLGRTEQALISDPQSHFTRKMLEAAARVYGPMTFETLQQKAAHYGTLAGYWAHYLRASA